MSVKRIAIMASGSGSNAQRIIEYFADNKDVMVDCLLSNNPDAYALERAENMGIDTLVFDRSQFYESVFVEKFLTERRINLVVLAGFLWLIPEKLVQKFKIINIHPALLPQYGGKNMYGMRVHRSVIENKEPFSGITIHHVNEKYDDGAIIFQAKCPLDDNDTPESLAEKIHQLEHQYYPPVIARLLSDDEPGSAG
jgi:phosphoribosylglycinamide formyltransferase 1